MRPVKIDFIKYSAYEKFVDDQLLDQKSCLSKSFEKLKTLRNKKTDPNELLILDHILFDFKLFLLQKPKEHEDFIHSWKALDPDLFYDSNIAGKDKKTPFGKEIIGALNYTQLRKKHGVDLLFLSGLKACPYCNAMLTVKVKKDKVNIELDHFYPKAKFPYLRISLFNLIPSCSNCNKSKSDDTSIIGKVFHLFAEETPLDAFLFKIDRKEVIQKVLGKQTEKLEFEFTNKKNIAREYVKKHNESFHIQGLYETQKDLVEELVWISQAYDKSTIATLSKTLRLSEIEIKRMLIGNYVSYEDIHKRPMSKFMQDIAKQLEII